MYFIPPKVGPLGVGLLTLLTAGCQSSPGDQGSIEATDHVLRNGVLRLGMNLGSQSFYDSGQMMKNLLFRNPGFEGEIYQSVIRCASGTGDSCTDDNPSAAWPSGFWDGASYEFFRGKAHERTGGVRKSVAPAGGLGTIFVFAEDGPAPETGDYMILRKTVDGNGQLGWWPSSCCGGLVSTELHDLAPDTEGRQSIRLSALDGGQAAIASFLDSVEGRTFLQLNGRYKLTFKAKGAGGSNRLEVNVARNANPVSFRYLSRTLTLAPEWRNYSLEFSANESGSSLGTLQVDFTPAGANVLLDDVALERVNGDPANHTAFRDPVVDALRRLRPGILRFWAGQLGETLDNQLSPEFSRRRAGFSAWSSAQDDIHYSLPEFLTLCEAIGARPYYVIPTAFSSAEMRGLIEFLAGSVATKYGSKRAALGHAEPWTRTFPKIYLEFGNEAWNGIFKGGSIEDAAAYGARAAELFRTARAADGFQASRFALVIGGQASNPGRNRTILAASGSFDALAVAPYQMNEVNSFAGNEELFVPLFAEPKTINAPDGYMGRNATLVRAAAGSPGLMVYEANVSTTGGTISQAALDRLVPSMGSGLAVAENMLLMLRDLGVREQMFWSLPQYSLKRGDGKVVKLYGAVVDMGVTNRKRPQYLALELLNQAILDNLIETRETGAAGIESFGFASGPKRSLVLLNLNVRGAVDVDFRGADAPRGRVEIKRLHAPSIDSNNEDGENVTITTRTVTPFRPRDAMLLPPYSITVLTWRR